MQIEYGIKGLDWEVAPNFVNILNYIEFLMAYMAELSKMEQKQGSHYHPDV